MTIQSTHHIMNSGLSYISLQMWRCIECYIYKGTFLGGENELGTHTLPMIVVSLLQRRRQTTSVERHEIEYCVNWLLRDRLGVCCVETKRERKRHTVTALYSDRHRPALYQHSTQSVWIETDDSQLRECYDNPCCLGEGLSVYVYLLFAATSLSFSDNNPVKRFRSRKKVNRRSSSF
jgi:hypothetical protein